MRKDQRATPSPCSDRSNTEPYHGEISVELAPGALNDYLRRRFGLELFSFARTLSYSFWLAQHRRGLFAPQELSKYLHGLEKLRVDILAPLRRIDRRPPAMTDEEIASYYKLEPFFNLIGGLNCTSDLGDVRGLGPGLGVISMTAVRWGRLAKDSENPGTTWPLLADLYMWFWERLRGYSYYELANPEKTEESDIETFLRVQYSRYKNEESIVPLGTEGAKISGLTVLGSDFTWSTPQSIFFTRIALADKKAGEPINPIHQMVMQIYEQHGYDVWGWARAATKLPGKLRVRFDELPRKRQLELLPRVPPLIIFPNGSYFSTDF